MKHIVFLDGECLFCQRFARLLHHWDQSQTIYFSSLGGETASMLPASWKITTDEQGHPTGAAALVECAGQADERRWRSADAILRALRLTRGPLAICWLFYYVPGFIKNRLYSWVARNRHHLTRNNKTCPLPSQTFQDRLLP